MGADADVPDFVDACCHGFLWLRARILTGISALSLIKGIIKKDPSFGNNHSRWGTFDYRSAYWCANIVLLQQMSIKILMAAGFGAIVAPGTIRNKVLLRAGNRLMEQAPKPIVRQQPRVDEPGESGLWRGMTEDLNMESLAAENKVLRKKLALLEKEKEVWRKTQFIANAADQLLTMIDRNYTYESVNQAYCRARGQRHEDVVGKSVSDVWGKTQFDSIIKPKLDHCFCGNVTSSEDWFKFDGKELRCYQVTYNPYRNDTGQITHAVVVTHDITARKHAEAGMKKANDRLERRVQLRTEALEQANNQLRNEIEERKRVEKALRESEDRYRSVSRDMPAMVCRYLPDGTLTFANIRFRKHFSVSSETLLSTNIFTFFSDTERQRMKNRLQQLRPHRPMVTYEQHTRTEEGETRWRQWTDRALFDEQGNAMEYQSVSIDITEKKDVESKLQQAQKMEAIGTLAGGIAHDFNNLLMGIQGNISLMYLDVNHWHPLYDNIHSIEQLVDSGANLTRQLLGFARGGKYVVKPLNLNDVVAETAACSAGPANPSASTRTMNRTSAWSPPIAGRSSRF
jgi:two-component system cell cycle sensor histidine kinase/response regulator CckA